MVIIIMKYIQAQTLLLHLLFTATFQASLVKAVFYRPNTTLIYKDVNEVRNVFSLIEQRGWQFPLPENPVEMDDSNETNQGVLSNLILLAEKKLDELYNEVDKYLLHGQVCTPFVPINPDKDPDPLHTFERVETVLWLKDIEAIVQLLPRNFYVLSEMPHLMWTILNILDNAKTFAIKQKENGNTIKLCDHTKLLYCDNHVLDELDPTYIHKCLCRSIDFALLNPRSYDRELFHNSAIYSKKLDLCVIKAGEYCPLAPTHVFCEPGSHCLTLMGRYPCTFENLAKRYGIFEHLAMNQSMRKRLYRDKRKHIDSYFAVKIIPRTDPVHPVKETVGRNSSSDNQGNTTMTGRRFSAENWIASDFFCSCYLYDERIAKKGFESGSIRLGKASLWQIQLAIWFFKLWQ